MLKEKLLQLESDLSVSPSPYALSIKEFAAVVKEYGKEATKYLSYIYFISDPRSRYAGYDPETRRKIVAESIFGTNIKESKILKDAITEYAKNTSSAALLLEAARDSVTKLKQWLSALDPSDESYDATKHVRILQDMGKTVNRLKELEKAVENESEVSDTYGGVEVSRYNE